MLRQSANQMHSSFMVRLVRSATAFLVGRPTGATVCVTSQVAVSSSASRPVRCGPFRASVQTSGRAEEGPGRGFPQLQELGRCNSSTQIALRVRASRSVPFSRSSSRSPSVGPAPPHRRGLHARQRRVAPSGHRLGPDTQAPRDLIDHSLALEDLQQSVLAVPQAAAARSPALPAVLLLALILSRHR
jgi:hypothetical protein